MKTVYARFEIVEGESGKDAERWLKERLSGIRTRTVAFHGMVEAADILAEEKPRLKLGRLRD